MKKRRTGNVPPPEPSAAPYPIWDRPPGSAVGGGGWGWRLPTSGRGRWEGPSGPTPPSRPPTRRPRSRQVAPLRLSVRPAPSSAAASSPPPLRSFCKSRHFTIAGMLSARVANCKSRQAGGAPHRAARAARTRVLPQRGLGARCVLLPSGLYCLAGLHFWWTILFLSWKKCVDMRVDRMCNGTANSLTWLKLSQHLALCSRCKTHPTGSPTWACEC